jgi:hypothetical protein
MQIVDGFARISSHFIESIMAFLGFNISSSDSCCTRPLQKLREASTLSQTELFAH